MSTPKPDRSPERLQRYVDTAVRALVLRMDDASDREIACEVGAAFMALADDEQAELWRQVQWQKGQNHSLRKARRADRVERNALRIAALRNPHPKETP